MKHKIMNWLRSAKHRIAATLVITFITLFLLACSPVAKSYTSHLPMTVIDWSQNNVMTVNADNGSMGSGWWIDNDTFITACHVVGIQLHSYDRPDPEGPMILKLVDEIAEEAQVASHDMSVVLNLKVQSCNFDTDVAVLKRQWLASDSDYKAYNTSSAQSFIGENVYCTGYGLMLNLHTTTGHYQGPLTRKDSRGHDLVTCPTIFGDSGSPALVLRSDGVHWVGIRIAVANGMGTPISHLTIISTVDQVEAELK